MKRQLMFLHYILKEDKNSLLSRFFDAQLKNPGKNDWVTTAKETLFLDFDQIEMATQYQFENLVEKEIEKRCFQYLIEEKKKRNKVKHIKHEKSELQSYLMPGNHSTHQAKQIFLLRNRMLETRDNFPNKFQDENCPVYENGAKDSQAHVMICPGINNQYIVDGEMNYADLFHNDVI